MPQGGACVLIRCEEAMAGLEEKLAGLKAAHEAGGLDDEQYADACALVREEFEAAEPEPEPAEPEPETADEPGPEGSTPPEGVPPEPEPEIDAEAAAAEATEAAAAAAAAAQVAAQKQAEAEAARKLKEQQENMAAIAQLAQSLTGKEKQTYAQQLTSSMDRRLIRQGVLRKQGDVKISPRYFFLFNDMMLFCKFNEGKKGKATTYEPRKSLSAENLKKSALKVLESERDLKDKELAFEMKTPGYDTVLYAATAEERREWVLALKQVLTDLREDPAETAYGELHRLVEGTLHHAALVGDVDLAQRCIAPPRDPGLLDALDVHGATALHVACLGGKDGVAALLVEAGASASILDTAGRSAVHLAATGGHVDIISDAFAAPGVDLDVADKADTTPLRHALESDNMSVATMLVASGAEPNRANASGWTGLHVAAQAGQADAVRRWIAVGADCNTAVADAGGKHDGYTALLLAARAPADAAEATITVPTPAYIFRFSLCLCLSLCLSLSRSSCYMCIVRNRCCSRTVLTQTQQRQLASPHCSWPWRSTTRPWLSFSCVEAPATTALRRSWTKAHLLGSLSCTKSFSKPRSAKRCSRLRWRHPKAHRTSRATA